MGKSYLLGFDAGTYESKGTICDLNGNVVATAAAPHLLKVPKPGYAEHDPMQDWWGDFKKIVRELLDKTGIRPEEIASVGVSTIMAAIVPVDREGNPLRNAILYGIDSRARRQVIDINNELGIEEQLKNVGAATNNESFGPKIRWIHDEEPEIFNKTYQFTITSSFINLKLTGNNIVDRYSACNCLPMFNAFTNDWYPDYVEPICRLDQLPVIARSTDVIGRITREAALETGLAEGTPVVAGSTDGGSEAVSIGVVEPGDMMLMYGSTMFISLLADRRLSEIGLWVNPYTVGDSYSMTAGMATTGSLTRWLRDQMGRDLLEKEAAGGENAYAALFREAESVPPGSDGLIVLPYFLGERKPIDDPEAKGVIFGLNLRHTRGHIVRAALEGIAYGLDQNLAPLKEAGIFPKSVTSVGGGTKSRIWMQIISDVCGIRQMVPEVTVGASYGDAMIAGIGIGALTEKDIKKIVKMRCVIEPDPEKHAGYEKYKKYYAELYQRNKDIMHAL